MRSMRVNLLPLVGMMLLLAGLNALQHDFWMAGAFVGLACFLSVAHVIRVRRFKRFDDAKNFD